MMSARADKFRQAAVAYVGIGVIVIALTLIAGTSPERGIPPLKGLIIGAAFVVLFGALMYAYGWLERGWDIWQNRVQSLPVYTKWGTVHKLIVVYIFPYIYFLYYLIKHGGGPKVIVVVLANIFVVSNWLRMLQYFINFMGYRLELTFRPFSVAVHPSEFSFPIIFLICGLLMAGITYMLARAAWDL
jgi:hypothetical protein